MKGDGRGIPKRRLLALWFGTFVVLASTLPAAPDYRTPDLGLHVSDRFADDRTLIALQREIPTWSQSRAVRSRIGPLVVLDVPTGKMVSRPIGEIEGLLASDEWDSIGGWEDKTRWNLIHWSLRGEKLLLSMGRRGDGGLVHLEEWRTGRTLVSRRIPSDFAVRVLHDRIWIHRQEGPGPVTAIRLETGETIESRLASDEIDWPSFRISPDGKRVASRRDGQALVWDVDSEKRLLAGAEAAHFAFSPDSTRLVTLSAWDEEQPEQHRTWRVYDLAEGALLQEWRQTEIREASAEDRTCGVGFEGEQCLCASFDPNILLRQGRFSAVPVDRVDRWNRTTGEIAIDRPPFESWYWCYNDPGEFEPTPPALLNRKAQRTFGCGNIEQISSGHLIAISGDRRWGAIGKQVASLAERLPAWIVAWWPWSVRSSSLRFTTQLYNLETGVRGIDFGENASVTFTPDSRHVLMQNGEGLAVWAVPYRRPLLRAFGWSLLVPAAWFFLRLPKRRRSNRN